MKISEFPLLDKYNIYVHTICTRTAPRTKSGVKKQFLMAVVAVIDRETIARGPEDPRRHSGTGGNSRGAFWAPEARKS